MFTLSAYAATGISHSKGMAGRYGATPSRGTMISTTYKHPSTQFHSISFQNNFGPPRFVPTGMAVGVERSLGLVALNKEVCSSRGPPRPQSARQRSAESTNFLNVHRSGTYKTIKTCPSAQRDPWRHGLGVLEGNGTRTSVKSAPIPSGRKSSASLWIGGARRE